MISLYVWSLMSPADNTDGLQAVISWLFRVTGAPHLAVGPSLSRALSYGMRCLTMSEIRRWDATHFNVSSRHFCSRSTSFPSALEVLHDYALYKFTIDIDIDIGVYCGLHLCVVAIIRISYNTLFTNFVRYCCLASFSALLHRPCLVTVGCVTE